MLVHHISCLLSPIDSVECSYQHRISKDVAEGNEVEFSDPVSVVTTLTSTGNLHSKVIKFICKSLRI